MYLYGFVESGQAGPGGSMMKCPPGGRIYQSKLSSANIGLTEFSFVLQRNVTDQMAPAHQQVQVAQPLRECKLLHSIEA